MAVSNVMVCDKFFTIYSYTNILHLSKIITYVNCIVIYNNVCVIYTYF